jgi:hypothetical protein
MENPDNTHDTTQDPTAGTGSAQADIPPDAASTPASTAPKQPHSVIADARLHEAEPALVDATTHVTVHNETVEFLHRLIDDTVHGVEGAAHRLQAAYRHVFGQPA